MDKLIESLFLRKVSDNYNTNSSELLNEYINVLNKSVNNRDGKLVTQRELNQIYQVGGHLDSSVIEHNFIPDGPVNANNHSKRFLLNTNYNSDQYGHEIPGVPNAAPDIDAAVAAASAVAADTAAVIKTTREHGMTNLNCSGAPSQCSDMSTCGNAYTPKKNPTFIESIIQYFGAGKAADPVSDLYANSMSRYFGEKGAEPVVAPVVVPAPSAAGNAMAGGGRASLYNMEQFNKIINEKATFKMTKPHRIQFKNFLDYKMNQ